MSRPATAACERDQALRLARFRAAYRRLSVRMLSPDGPWQDVIAEDDGEMTVTRYERGALLDRLAELLGEPQ